MSDRTMSARINRWTLLLALAAAPLGAALTAPPAAAQQQATHTVQAGETLFAIARRYGVSVADLRALNNLTSDNIRVGQRLVVGRGGGAAPAPAPPVAAPAPAPEAPRVEPLPPQNQPARVEPLPAQNRPVLADVGRGLQTGTPPDIVRPDPIPAGPPPPPPPPATVTRVDLGAGALQPFPTEPAGAGGEGGGVHVVQAGETLSALARRYDTTVEALRQANGLTGDGLAVGQRLRVPGGVAGGGAPAVATPRPGRFDVNRTTVADDEVHAVLPGETLFSIAARYGTTAGRLLAVNTVGSGPLAPGTVLALPDGVGARYHRAPAPPRPADEAGLALVYPASYVGRTTISGEPYDASQLTASHRTHPFGTVLEVTAPGSGRRTLVRVNDRGPVSEGFLVELSEAAAQALGLRSGSAERVEVRVLR